MIRGFTLQISLSLVAAVSNVREGHLHRPTLSSDPADARGSAPRPITPVAPSFTEKENYSSGLLSARIGSRRKR